MYLNCYLDKESSRLSEKLIFINDRYFLTKEDIKTLKQKKLLNLIEEDSLPEKIECQVIIQFENYNKIKVMIFNTDFKRLPEEIFEESLLNKDLIEAFKIK
jgi:hypothetical protein